MSNNGPNNNTETLHPNNFKLESTSIWSFPERGNWAFHNGSYRGNWSPYIPRNLILRYSKKGDTILDQFLGGGTTLIEASLLERRGIGIDINPHAIQVSKQNLSKINLNNNYSLSIGNAKELIGLKNDSVDLICTHPPYANIIKYSDHIKDDLSRMDRIGFLDSILMVARESYRVLKSKRYCAIMVGDIRQKGNIIPLGFQIMEMFIEAGFTLKEIIIKQQHNCKSTKYWVSKSMRYNFLLIAHEYIFIFYKA